MIKRDSHLERQQHPDAGTPVQLPLRLTTDHLSFFRYFPAGRLALIP